jgi:hypothetical protein
MRRSATFVSARKSRSILRLIAQIWLLLLIIGSLQPSRPGSVLAHHRSLHFLIFGVAAILWLLLARTWRQEVIAAVALCILGLTLEYLQHFFYRNVMEWWDVRDDSLAIVAAFTLYRFRRLFTTSEGPA